MRTLLIDGDILIYRSGFAVEKTYEFDDGQWSTTADLDEAAEKLDEDVKSMVKVLQADEVIVALSDHDNWRKELYPNYKLQRTKTRKPILIKPLRAYVSDTYSTYIRPTLEADDVLGILQTWDKLAGDKIICTIDKDLRQIPGKHFHLVDRTKKTVTDEEGSRLHMLQTLTGDMVDNYPGCPGVGPKSAEKILAGLTKEDVWPAVVAAYEKKGLTEEDALVQARIARICRASDYDFKTKTVRLWSPSPSN